MHSLLRVSLILVCCFMLVQCSDDSSVSPGNQHVPEPDVIVEFDSASLKDFGFEDPQLAAAVEQLDFQTGAAALP